MFVVDYSNNGTFIDGIKIGKDKKLPLVNNAVIALSERRNRGEKDTVKVLWYCTVLLIVTIRSHLILSVCLPSVFVFIDLISGEQASLPKELQEKYLLTRRIGT